MKKLLVSVIIVFTFNANAQVGINTTDPKAQLEIQSSNQANPSTTDGLLVPKIDIFPLINPGADQQGMLVYLTTTVGVNQPGFYYWDNVTTSWLPIKGSDTGTLDQAYDFGGAGNGRTITADVGAILINGTDGLVSTGILNSGATAPSGGGTRMVWNPNKAAFRAGSVVGTQWDDINIGHFSAAFGSGTIASSDFSNAFGNNTIASGESSVTFGSTTRANGFATVAFGQNTQASGLRSAAFGQSTIAIGNASTTFGFNTATIGIASTAFGNSNNASSYGETVLGIGATLYTPSSNGATQFRAVNATDRLFVIGNAIDINGNSTVDIAERSDAMVVLKNGNIGIGSSTPQDKLHVVGNIRMVDGNEAAGKILVSDANGTASWSDVSSANGWGINGNSGTDDTLNFLGTTDAEDLVFKTNNLDVGRFTSDAKFRLGMNNFSDTWTNVSKMEIGSDDAVNDVTLRSSGTDALAINMVHSRGTMSVPIIPNVGDEIGSLRFWAYNQTGPFSGYTFAGRITSFVKASSIGNVDTALQLSSTGGSILIDDLGNVGIGINTPSRKLHIVSSGLSGGTSNANTGILLENNTNVYQHFLTPSNRESGLLFGSDAASIEGGIVFNNPSISKGLVFRTGGNTNRMVLTNGGNVGIGTLSPGGQFELTLDEGRKPGTSTWTIVSDQRLKTIKGNYTKGLSEILQLNPIRFNYKEAGGRKFDQDVLNTEFFGFIAQEVQQFFPEAVGTDDDGYLNLNMHPILVASINALKELNVEIQKKNRNLETENQNQNIIIQDLLRRIENLEKRQSLND